jgi:hypothetical protein
MVYILAANKFHKYKNGRSRILYIGTTKKGGNRPAASAVNKASEAFYKLRGVRTIDVHIVTCAPHKAMQTWKRLESALLDVFRNKYFQLPRYNKVRPIAREGLFSTKALDKIIREFHGLRRSVVFLVQPNDVVPLVYGHECHRPGSSCYPFERSTCILSVLVGPRRQGHG